MENKILSDPVAAIFIFLLLLAEKNVVLSLIYQLSHTSTSVFLIIQKNVWHQQQSKINRSIIKQLSSKREWKINYPSHNLLHEDTGMHVDVPHLHENPLDFGSWSIGCIHVNASEIRGKAHGICFWSILSWISSFFRNNLITSS